MKNLILTLAFSLTLASACMANEYTALASRTAAELQAEQAAKELRADLYREQAEQAAQAVRAEMQAEQQRAESEAAEQRMLAAIDERVKPLMEKIEQLQSVPKAKKPDERPMVTVYTPDFDCPPCKRMKKEQADLPVNATFTDATKAVKEWIDEKPKERGYPVIHYKVGEKWFYHCGYSGVDDFKKWWEAEKARGVKPILPYSSAAPSGNHYTPHWTWPGNLAQHLRDTHGINPSGMSQDQMEQAHDRSHDGGFRAGSAPVQHAFNGVFGRRRGGCPNGMCPR